MSMNVATLAHNTALRLRLLEVQSEMNQTQMEVSTGKKSDIFSGLRSDTRTSISLSVTKSTTEIYKQNINVAKTRTDTMQTVLKRINDIAVELKNAAIEASSVPVTATGSSTAVTKQLAQERLREIASLLNTEVDGRYLFSGFDITNPPMIDPGAIGSAGTPLDDIAALAPALDTTAASGTTRYTNITNYLNTVANYYTGDTSATNATTVRIDDGTDITYGVRGDDTAIRTVLRGIYALATTDLTTAGEGGYRQILQLSMNDLDAGQAQVTQVSAVLGVRQATMDETYERHSNFLVTLAAQLSDVEDVDAAESLSRMTLLQTNLEASYRLLATTRSLTLSSFL
jgi:flagellar hook-associated protein 3 FlgL